MDGARDDDDVVALLARLAVFVDLPEEALYRVASSLEFVDLESGQTLFSEGDPSDGLYVVLGGRVRVYVTEGSRESQLQELGRGQVFGEVSLVSSMPRTATVRAVRDTTLARLSPVGFVSIVEEHPSVALKLAAGLASRLIEVDRSASPSQGCRTLLITFSEGVDRQPFLTGFVSALEELGPTQVVRAGDRPGSRTQDPDTAESLAGLASWLHGIEERCDHVVLLDEGDEAWARWCEREADSIVHVAHRAHSSPKVPRTGQTRQEVVVHPPGTTRASGHGRTGVLVHHVRDGSDRDMQRLARRLTGRAHGVVLSGGGARGFAHLGALRALEELGHPIDVIGGTSIGAVAGSLLAMGFLHEERVELLSRALKRRRAVFPLTLPVLSIASGHKVEALLDGLFGDMLIEDLWLGFFCVSANLTRAETVVHDAGPVAPALRATFSLPGILPPVVADGDLLIDGGVMNNLPVDVMRRVVENGDITAIDLRPVVDLRMSEREGAVPSWRVLASNLKGASDHPTVIDVLMRTVELGSAQAQRAHLTAARVTHYLRPPAQNVRLSDFQAGSALVDLGYRYTLEQMAEGTA